MSYCFVSPAIPPPINVEPFDTNTAMYEMKSSYNVESGNEFNVICTSLGTFSGRVTWINNGRNLCGYLSSSQCSMMI